MHCHTEVHQLEGMAVIIQEYSNTEHNLPKDINKPGKFNWTVADFVRLSAGECIQSLSTTLLSTILFMSCVVTAGY